MRPRTNSGIGISIGDESVVEAGLYVTAGTKVSLVQSGTGDATARTVKAVELSGVPGLLFRRNSLTGTVDSSNAGSGVLNPDTTYSDDIAPDVIVKGTADPGWGHYEVFGLARFLHDRTSTIGNGSNQAKAAAMLDLEVLAERAVGQASAAIAPGAPRNRKSTWAYAESERAASSAAARLSPTTAAPADRASRWCAAPVTPV